MLLFGLRQGKSDFIWELAHIVMTSKLAGVHTKKFMIPCSRMALQSSIQLNDMWPQKAECKIRCSELALPNNSESRY